MLTISHLIIKVQMVHFYFIEEVHCNVWKKTVTISYSVGARVNYSKSTQKCGFSTLWYPSRYRSNLSLTCESINKVLSFCLILFTSFIILIIVVTAAWCPIIFNNQLYCLDFTAAVNETIIFPQETSQTAEHQQDYQIKINCDEIDRCLNHWI